MWDFEQRTRLIDWYVRRKIDIYENPNYNKSVCITSVNYVPNKIYDPTHGLYRTSRIVGFLDPRLKELYKGKYPILELDVGVTKVDYSKIKVMNTSSFFCRINICYYR